MKEYRVKGIKRIENLSEMDFSEAVCLSDFTSPWTEEEVKPIEFRALHSGTDLFFQYKVFDAEIHVDDTDDSVDAIGKSDRVELFFRTDERLIPYYCLEIDPSLRVMDFIAYPGKQFMYNWQWPKGQLELHRERFEDGFIVSGRISKKSLNNFELIKGRTLEVGLFRAKFNEIAEGEYEPTWISWVDPKTAEPNFHINTSFGKFILD